MHTPLRTAAWPAPTLGVASLLSVLAHAGALSLALWAGAQIDAPASMGQRKGAITIRLTERPARQAALVNARPLVNTPVSQDKVQRSPSSMPRPAPAPTRALVTAETSAATETLPSSPPEAPSQDTAAQEAAAAQAPEQARPAQAAGATFANLFAPLISRPMGRGRWGSHRPATTPEPDPTTLSQAQALMQTTQALQERMRSLEATLATSPIQGPCQIDMDLTNRWGRVQCPQPQDTARVWGYLRDILLEGSVIPTQANGCVAIDGRALNWVACQSASAQTSDAP